MHVTNRSRRLMAACAAACLALTVGLAGCQQASDSDARVDELEQQVEDLQKQLDEKSSATGGSAQDSGSAGASGGTAGATAQTDEALSSELAATYPELADFEARAAELEAACQDVQVSDDRNANYQTFIGVKQQIDALEHEMDTYDENQELAAKNGTLAYDDYMRIERAIDYLDDRLSYAKDGMELTLGIDD